MPPLTPSSNTCDPPQLTTCDLGKLIATHGEASRRLMAFAPAEEEQRALQPTVSRIEAKLRRDEGVQANLSDEEPQVGS